MGKKIALGAGAPGAAVKVADNMTLEERVIALQHQVEQLTAAFHVVNSVRVKDRRTQKTYEEFSDLLTDTNRDGIPVGISLVGNSQRGGIHVLTVHQDKYFIGAKEFDSLSAAAEASSGVRRSGWTFWKLPDGRTLKEAFGKR